ncbi:cytokine receptor-like isoform X2 [Anastrepha ludens]|uniref:cytokine receptor-like isoform X2 n=1 Tax=Anastrepha ludens TaxID=28586 RepID=UPI0023B15726|nr:cytokine receptor-like isoform X2 [Anastrepha ludens]
MCAYQFTERLESSWRALMLGFCVILLHATVAVSVEATTIGIAAVTTTTAAMLTTMPGTTALKPTNDVVRRSIRVGYGGTATILCKTSKRSNTYFYDVTKKQILQSINIDNELLKPYAILVLHRVHQASTYQCLQNATLLSETILAVDSSTQTVRIEMGNGDDVALTCKHDDDQQVYFQRQTWKDFDSTGSSENVFTDIVPIDNRMSILLISNATSQFSTFSCTYLNNKHIDESELYVGTPPTPVKNFTCRGHNYRSMTCEFPIPPNNILPKYNLTYLVDFQRDLKNCDLKFTTEKGILVLNTTFYASKCPYYPTGDIYKFNLFTNNVLGNFSEDFSINNHECVIPPKLNIYSKDITSNSVSLFWTDYQKHYYRLGVLYDIFVKPIYIDGYSVTTPCRGLECNMILKNLTYANWNYTLTVRARVNATTSTWNEPSIVTFLTNQRIPDRAPKTIVGGFYIHYNSAEKEISLYWEELAQYEENGHGFHYSIQELDLNGKVLNWKTTKETSVVFSWLDQPRVYEVRAVNALGASQAVSRIRVDVPRTANAPQRIEQLLHSNGSLVLTWQHPADFKQQPPSNYTVFWCQEKLLSLTMCKGSMHFKVVDNKTTEFSIDSEDRTLIMAVAANYPNWSTGLHWKTCYGALGGSLETVIPEAVATSATNIALRWRLEKTCIKAFKGYNITYCEVQTIKQAHCDSMNTHVTLESPGIKQINLTNLKAYSLYRITMLLYAEGERRSQPSEFIFCRTKDAAPDPPTNVRFEKASITSNSVNILWDAPKVTNGMLKKYTVWRNSKNYTTNIDIPVWNLTEYGGTNISYKLEGLSSYSTYEVWVTAWTSEESNQSASLEINTLIGRPSAPRDVELSRNGSYYMFKWTDPEMPSGRVELYELKFFEGDKETVSLVQRGSKLTHQCRLKYPGCTDAVQKMEVRAINVVREEELDKTAFPIKGKIVRRRRYSNPAISTSAIHIQTTTSAEKNNNDAVLHEIVFHQNDDDAMGGYHERQHFDCELLDEDITTKFPSTAGVRWLMSAPGSSGLFNCETFPYAILVASLIFVGMFIATISWSYNFVHRQLGVRVKFPDPVNDLIIISTKIPDKLADNKHEDNLCDRSMNFDAFRPSKEAAYLLKYGTTLTPSSSESGVHGVGGADSVSRSSSREDVDDECFAQCVPKDEPTSSASTTTLNDTSLSSHQNSPLQRRSEQIQAPTRNDGYLCIEQITGTKPQMNDDSCSSSDSSYLPLHSIAPKSPPNTALTASDAANVENTIATSHTISAPANCISTTATPPPTTAVSTGAANAAIFSNYLPHNFLQVNTTQPQPNLFTNFALATGDYVLPDVLPKIAASHTATKKEENEAPQKPLQQQINPIVSYGYVTSDFWSKQNTMQ